MPPRLLLLIVLAGAALSPPAHACSIPVFRYALERWKPDAYEVVVFHRGPLAPDDQKLTDELSRAGKGPGDFANIRTTLVDLAGTVDQSYRQLWERHEPEGASLPWMVVRYPKGLKIENDIWAGSPTPEVIHALLRSPAREQIANRLMKGQSVVWLLLESGGPKKDDVIVKMLQTELRRLEKELKLPEDEPKPAEERPKRPGVSEPEPVKPLSDLPIRINFSVLRVSRTDPAEKMLVAMLLRAHKDLEKTAEPAMFPVFGRGRALEAFVGKEISAEVVKSAATFLCGACSCEVKGLNPGVDLLFSAAWDNVLKEGASKVEEPPRKVGASVPIPPTTGQEASAATSPDEEEAAEVISLASGGRIFLLAGIAVAGMLVVVTGVMALRPRR